MPPARSRSGFSFIELIVVMAILMIFATMVIPLINTAVEEYRVRSSTVDLNSLLQRVRIRSVRDNRAYTIATSSLTEGSLAYTRLSLADVNGNVIAGGPSIQFQRGVQPATGSYPQIANASLGFTPQVSTVTMSFNGRGTPCVVRNGVCGSWDPNGVEVGFVYYLQYPTKNVTRLAAVSVSPSGRLRAWKYDRGSWSN